MINVCLQPETPAPEKKSDEEKSFERKSGSDVPPKRSTEKWNPGFYDSMLQKYIR